MTQDQKTKADERLTAEEFNMPQELYDKILNESSVAHGNRTEPAWIYSLRDASFAREYTIREMQGPAVLRKLKELQSLKLEFEAKSKALEIAKELKESAKDLLRIRCETSIGAVECDIRDFEEALAEIESLEKESGE